MKHFNFLSTVIVVLLMVTAVSCTTMRGTGDNGYYDTGVSSNRVYVDDPYRGTVVLERDPYTGRYYEVNTYGSVYSPYGYRNNRYGNNNRRYNRNNGYYNNNGYSNNNTDQRQSQEQKREQDNKREDARKKILGGGN